MMEEVCAVQGLVIEKRLTRVLLVVFSKNLQRRKRRGPNSGTVLLQPYCISTHHIPCATFHHYFECKFIVTI